MASPVDSSAPPGIGVRKVLSASAAIWFVTAVAGQWMFVGYLLAHYVVPALRAGLSAWSSNDLSTGYIPGDAMGNAAVAAHIFLALIIFGAGPLQFVARIRARFPTLHRWNGSIYMVAVVATSFTGFYMVWVRGNPQAGVVEHIGTTVGGVLIVAFATIAFFDARAGNIDRHRRWALRMFMVVSGVWFIRLAYGLWLFAFDGPGSNFKTFSVLVSYAQYLVPLGILESYLLALRWRNHNGQLAFAGFLLLLAAATIFGVYQASVALWLPRLLSMASHLP